MAELGNHRSAKRYVNAKHALVYSEDRIMRMIKSDQRMMQMKRRPVGSTLDHPGLVKPDLDLARHGLHWQLHLNALAEFFEAHRRYYGSQRPGIGEVLSRSIRIRERLQEVGAEGVERDLARFMREILEDRCRQARDAFRRREDDDTFARLCMVCGEAQALGCDGPGIRAAADTLQEHTTLEGKRRAHRPDLWHR